MELMVNDDNFQEEVIESKLPVLVDFFATWCGPCRMLAPTIEVLAEEMEGKAKVVKVDVDQSPMTTREYQIMAVPTLIVFKDGDAVQQLQGVQPIEVIREALLQ